MAMVIHDSELEELQYPCSDGKPMAESDLHRNLITEVIWLLQRRYLGQQVYVSGNLLLYYLRGNRRKRVAPDVFLVRGISPRLRRCFLLWNEARGPEVVIEFTSSSTRHEDQKKFELYRDVLKVQEYFLFDPYADYLDPPLQGYDLVNGHYVPIQEVDRRLSSGIMQLHLKREGRFLRLYDPATLEGLFFPQDAADHYREEAKWSHKEAEKHKRARKRAESKLEKLQREIEGLRRQLGAGHNGHNPS